MVLVPVRHRGIPLVLLSSVFFAAMAVCARSLSGRMPASEQVVIRFAIGLLGIVPVFFWRREWPRIRRPLLWFLRGLIGAASVMLYFVAIERLETGPATLLNCMAPCWAALFAALFLRERIAGQGVVGLLVATAGAALVIWAVQPSGPGSTSLGGAGVFASVGVWAGAASAICSGGAQTIMKSLRQDTDAATVFLSFSVFGLLFALPVALPTWTPVSSELLLPALGVGVFSLAAQLLFTYAFKYVTAFAGSAATQLTPAVSWAMGVAFLEESISPLAVFGAVICLAGVMWGAGVGFSRLFRASDPRAADAPRGIL